MNLINRRAFIGGLSAFGIGGCRGLFTCTGNGVITGKPLLRFGVISDVHVAVKSRDWDMPAAYDTQTLVTALKYFRDQEVDAVVLAGDMAHHGICHELIKVAEAWFSVFPEDRAPDGRPVERLFVTGNHDNGTHRAIRVLKDKALAEANLICRDRDRWWREAFHEPFSPVWRKTVKGFDFIGCNWTIGDCRGKDEHFNDGIAAFYETLDGKLDPSRPFFHIQHPQPKGTAHGDKVWGQDDGTTGRILSKYPNAVAFSGHSHTSLLDEKSIWQGAFTSCGTATLRNVNLHSPGAVEYPDGRGYENSTTPNGKMRELNELKAMEPAVRDARQGQIVSVFADRMVFSRREFSAGLQLGEDVVMPLPVAEHHVFEPLRRRKTSPVPQFREGAKCIITKEMGTLRKTDESKRHVKAEVWRLEIPPADADRNAMVVAYEAVAKNVKGEDARFAVTAYNNFCYAPGDKRRNCKAILKIAASRLAEVPEFRVYAVNAWGAKSVPIQ